MLICSRGSIQKSAKSFPFMVSYELIQARCWKQMLVTAVWYSSEVKALDRFRFSPPNFKNNVILNLKGLHLVPSSSSVPAGVPMSNLNSTPSDRKTTEKQLVTWVAGIWIEQNAKLLCSKRMVANRGVHVHKAPKQGSCSLPRRNEHRLGVVEVMERKKAVNK